MKYNTCLIVLLFLFSCKEPIARRPKKHNVTNFYKEVIIENKRLNELEDKRIEHFLSKDTINHFKASSNGFWYAYLAKDSVSTITPKVNDLVTIEYDIKSINDQLIYGKQEINYKVDKQDFVPGLRDGIKLMKEGEEVIFIIPSYVGYGVTGDGVKIKRSQPIKSTLKLIKIKEQNNESK